MGLDAYIFSNPKPKQERYWRKNYELNEFMREEWEKQNPDFDKEFNLERLHLTDAVLNQLADKVRKGELGYSDLEQRTNLLNDILIYKDDIDLNSTEYFYTCWY